MEAANEPSRPKPPPPPPSPSSPSQKKGEIERALREALSLGRNQVLALDREGGEVLDTGVLLRRQAGLLTHLDFGDAGH